MIGNAHQTHGGLNCPVSADARDHSRPARCTNGGTPARLPPHIYGFHQRPGFITPAEFLSSIKRRILEVKDINPIKRFVLWDLTQLDYRFPLFAQDSMFLTALMDLCKAEKIKSLFMGAGNARYSAAASAMADNVLFCWRSQLRTKDKKSTKKEPVMLIYVDRIGDESHKPDKRLYAVPVRKNALAFGESDVPRDIDENQYETMLSPDDRKKIHLITNKQGFEGDVIR
jgi:hypothetical protein